MCGISGAISTDPTPDLDGLVRRIAHSQTARGPDALAISSFVLRDLRGSLGHNRLSIIDLSRDADQPMSTADNRYTIVFNGEIYNYIEIREELESVNVSFRTVSDTEVLLEAYKRWGNDAFSRFLGMFAVAILDRQTGSLLLARDRFGVKPLYYWSNGRTLVFASTARVIAQWAGLAPNLHYLARGLRYKYYEDDTDISPYEGLRALEAGSILHVVPNNGVLRLDRTQYYRLEERVLEAQARQGGMSLDDLESSLLELMQSACRLRLRADVPVGVSLSGGVDSTVVAALAAKHHPKLLGYSFAHPSDAESEADLVSDMTRHAAIEPRWVWPNTKEDIESLFWSTLHAQQAPFPHASMMAQFAVFRAARTDGVKVLLGGQAGDEAFMGYRKFYLFYAQSVLRQGRLSELAHLTTSMAPFAIAVLRRAGLFWSERARYREGSTGMQSRLRLPAPSRDDGQSMRRNQTPTDRQALDITRYSLPSLLRYEDRNSLGNSVESRLPFVDHRVIEFGVALPERFKLSNGFGKWILRSAAKDLIPASIRLNRDKRGFDVNQSRWIYGGLGQTLRDALNARLQKLEDVLPTGAKIKTMFSDSELSDNSQAFKEAVSMIWLADAR